jgi:hypothetical protein
LAISISGRSGRRDRITGRFARSFSRRNFDIPSSKNENTTTFGFPNFCSNVWKLFFPDEKRFVSFSSLYSQFRFPSTCEYHRTRGRRSWISFNGHEEDNVFRRTKPNLFFRYETPQICFPRITRRTSLFFRNGSVTFEWFASFYEFELLDRRLRSFNYTGIESANSRGIGRVGQ